MYSALKDKQKRIAVVGLGYVGLPIALELGHHFSVIGFDINQARVDLMRQGIDPSNELDSSAFQGSDIEFTANRSDLDKAHFYIVAVPTDVDNHKVPDLTPLQKASASVGKSLKKGDYVVFESTVYPGCTEEDCQPILEAESGLSLANGDFKLGYSPERIVPGEKERTLTKILKIVSGSDEEAVDCIAKVYETIIEPGVYRASSIKVAEAAKVIENTQRDINISLMNELSMIFDKMGIDTQEVIAAAGTKWNFIKLYPGLVGGHCIGVDPYYLMHKAKQVGYDPQVILSGRRINDGMPGHIAKRLVQLLIEKGKNPRNCKVLVLGVTFKENVSDIRNTKVVDLIRELMDYSVNVQIHDPHASPNEMAHEYKLTMVDQITNGYDAVVVAVAHKEYIGFDVNYFENICTNDPIIMDLKGVLDRKSIEQRMTYWRL
jgi:UDP-N-acetyl-D-glucosamine/UDP-N-acetyl-D-galactosamine dehydrogenase